MVALSCFRCVKGGGGRASDVDADEEEDHRRNESRHADAVHGIPLLLFCQGSSGRCVRSEARHAVGDGDEEEQGEDDDDGPDRYGSVEQKEPGLMAEEDGLGDEEEKVEAVPEGHDETEFRGEEADGGEAGSVVELVEDGVDEGGDGELSADHESDGEDGGDIEEGGHCADPVDETRREDTLTQMFVLTKLSVWSGICRFRRRKSRRVRLMPCCLWLTGGGRERFCGGSRLGRCGRASCGGAFRR